MGEKVETQRTKDLRRCVPSDTTSIERGVRQLLADKVSGNMVGIWLLIPEHLRLGTWDLLCGWTNKPAPQVEPRLALQLVHEAALCVSGVRESRSLSQKGFELANGLPFLASDKAIHELLNGHTVAEAKALQTALGQIRRASGHYIGKVLAIDPHRIRAYSKRQMRRHKLQENTKPVKVAQTFFCLDADSKQPICFTTSTSSTTVTQATPELLNLTDNILNARMSQPLVVADSEHFTMELIKHLKNSANFDLLVPMPNMSNIKKQMETIPQSLFDSHWAGFATAKREYPLEGSLPAFQIIQRCGEKKEEYKCKAFLATADSKEVDDLTLNYPKRWHVEEFFNANQALGWGRAGTQNISIRYGHMTLALIAQAAIHQARQRLGEPIAQWDAKHLAKSFFNGMDGDLRIEKDTIIVTYYNAPNVELLRRHYENLPDKLKKENIDPRIPWLYGLKLNFRFK